MLDDVPEVSPATGISLACLTLLYPPVAEGFIFAQSQTIILLLAAVAKRAMAARQDALAGSALAVAALLRAFPLVLAGYLLLRGKWRALLWMAAVFAAGTVGTVIGFGLERCVSWFEAVRWTSDYVSLLVYNLGLGSFVSRVFHYAFGGVGGPGINSLRKLCIGLAELAVLSLLVRATPGPARRDRGSRSFALWLAAAIIISPIAWIHYMLLFLVALVGLADDALCGHSNRPAFTAMAINYIGSFLAFAVWITLPQVAIGTIGGSSMWRTAAMEVGFPVMLAGFLGAYWFARDDDQSAESLAMHAPAQEIRDLA